MWPPSVCYHILRTFFDIFCLAFATKIVTKKTKQTVHKSTHPFFHPACHTCAEKHRMIWASISHQHLKTILDLGGHLLKLCILTRRSWEIERSGGQAIHRENVSMVSPFEQGHFLHSRCIRFPNSDGLTNWHAKNVKLELYTHSMWVYTSGTSGISWEVLREEDVRIPEVDWVNSWSFTTHLLQQGLWREDVLQRTSEL